MGDYTAAEVPRLCRLIRFVLLLSSPPTPHPPQLSTHTASHGETPLVYAEAKLAARSYQAAKQQLFRSLREAGLGTWVKKPPELDQFELPV